MHLDRWVFLYWYWRRLLGSSFLLHPWKGIRHLALFLQIDPRHFPMNRTQIGLLEPEVPHQRPVRRSVHQAQLNPRWMTFQKDFWCLYGHFKFLFTMNHVSDLLANFFFEGFSNEELPHDLLQVIRSLFDPNSKDPNIFWSIFIRHI